MKRPNSIIIFSLSLACILVNVKILYADIQIANAHIVNAHMGTTTDPCAGLSIGQTCTGVAIYAGTGYTTGGLNPILRYMVTPGGCTDEVCTGAGGTDSATKVWADGSGGNHAYNFSDGGATDVNNGKKNTSLLSPYFSDTNAASWCVNMNYGGYSDWYLPSSDELNSILYVNKAVLAGFAANNYWSSTASTTTHARFQDFSSGTQFNGSQTGIYYVRCIRSY